MLAIAQRSALFIQSGSRLNAATLEVESLGGNLINLHNDPGEATDLAGEHSEILQKIQARFLESRTEARTFPPVTHPTGIQDYVR